MDYESLNKGTKEIEASAREEKLHAVFPKNKDLSKKTEFPISMVQHGEGLFYFKLFCDL